MKILIENQLFRLKAGTEAICIDTYEVLKQNGHDVYFFATNDGEPFYEENYKYAKYFPKNRYSAREYLKNPIAYFWNFEAANKFSKMLEEVKPDIVHFNSWISPSILKVCKDKKIPAVMTHHMMPTCCPSTTFLYQNKKFCSGFKCKNGQYYHCILNKCRDNSLEASVRKTVLSYVTDLTNAYNGISYFICPSEALAKYVESSKIAKNSKAITINNFLNKEALQTIPNFSNKGYFLYVGRLSEEKGVQYILEAAKDLPKEIEFHIVGNGSKEKELKEFAKNNDLSNVKFLGYMHREQIKEEYQNCIATILPCNWFENFPTTNMESFINGKPVIASNIGGIPEQVEHECTGLLFEPANIEQLKEAILTYYKNPNIVIEHGKNAYHKAFTQYHENRYYEELIDIYNKTLSKNFVKV